MIGQISNKTKDGRYFVNLLEIEDTDHFNPKDKGVYLVGDFRLDDLKKGDVVQYKWQPRDGKKPVPKFIKQLDDYQTNNNAEIFNSVDKTYENIASLLSENDKEDFKQGYKILKSEVANGNYENAVELVKHAKNYFMDVQLKNMLNGNESNLKPMTDSLSTLEKTIKDDYKTKLRKMA